MPVLKAPLGTASVRPLSISCVLRNQSEASVDYAKWLEERNVVTGDSRHTDDFFSGCHTESVHRVLQDNGMVEPTPIQAMGIANGFVVEI